CTCPDAAIARRPRRGARSLGGNRLAPAARCSQEPGMSTLEKMRLDKWVWAARFYKTRSLAIEAIRLGRVQVNGKNAQPARDIAPGDLITIRKRLPPMHVEVLALSAVRGPAPVAQTLYRETPDSIEARERAAELRRLAPEPAHTRREGRPTKRDRRQMQRFRDRRWKPGPTRPSHTFQQNVRTLIPSLEDREIIPIISTRGARVLTTGAEIFHLHHFYRSSSMALRPLHDRVIVKRLDNERTTASGIVIPDSAAEKPDQGEIVAVGP